MKSLLPLALACALSLQPAMAYLCDLSTVFTPAQNGTQTYVDYIGENAKYSLYVAVYTMTSQRVADEYCRLAANGVIVKVILDKSQTLSIDKEQTLIDQMRRAGIEVLVTTSPDHHALMHSKFSIADHAYVIDGSWNYTDSADEQCNVLTFNQSRSPERAAPYIEAWNNLYSYAKASTSVSTIDQDLRLMQMAKGSAHGKHKRQSAHQHLRLSRD